MQNFVNNNYSPEVSYYGQIIDPSQNTSFNRATHPSDKPVISKHIFAVDSRQRNYDFFPEANNYSISIPDRYRNVTAIELKAAMLPRTEYNVNSANKHLDFSVGDFINKIITISPPLITHNINGKTELYGPATNVRLNISPPYDVTGIQAIIEVGIDSYSNIIPGSYNIIESGSGYIQSKPPSVSLGNYKDFKVFIGFNYTAKLREGQYVIGGNPQFTNNSTNEVLQSWTPSNLLCEVENAMSNAILEDADYCYSRRPWTSLNTLPSPTAFTDDNLLLFSARLMSQYPTLDTYTGVNLNENNYETNSCKFNRIYLSNCLIFVSYGGLPESPFSDTNFDYEIIKSEKISGITERYILYCKLQDPLAIGAISGTYYNGLTNDGDVQNFDIKLANWEILNATGEFNLINSAGLLGFSKQNHFNSTNNNFIEVNHPASASAIKKTTLIPNALTYSTQNDYYLFGDPEYIVLSFRPKFGGNTIAGINDRVDSQPDTNIDRVFACLIYDTVQPAVLQDMSSGKIDATIGSLANANNNSLGTFMNYDADTNRKEVKQLTGNSGAQNVSFNRPPGQLKAMKGADFDRKVVEFPQPVAQIFDLAIRFSKFTRLEGIPRDADLYDFHGKEHLLLFEITCSDLMTGKRF
jgi:hypothetical protein